MSKYQITHACGCTVTHNIVGTNVNGERESKAEWLSGRVCADCYRKQQNAKAAESNQGLPSLIGSEKQVSWAETIRSNAVKQLNELKGMIDATHPESAIPLGIINNIMQQSQSQYWIDNREVSYSTNWMIKQLQKQSQ